MEVLRTLPASWFTNQNVYDMEKRAVFEKSWFLLGPVVRFAEETSVDYEFAGIALHVQKAGEDNFHVTRKSDGRPVPHFLTPTGLLFTAIHPDAAPTFEEYFPPSLLPLLNKHDFRKLPHRRKLSYPGGFNWKTMVDGYQECLHCQYTHREFSAMYPPTFYAVQNEGNISRHFADERLTEVDDGLFLFLFPICTLNRYAGGMTSFRVCPGEKVGESRMEFDYYYLNQKAIDTVNAKAEEQGRQAAEEEIEKAGLEGFEEYYRFVRRVAMEDFELCEVAQSNLERGVYCQGVLNSAKENGVTHYQGLVRERVMVQFKAEQEEKEMKYRVDLAVGASQHGQDVVEVMT
ncbi:hypothetical protein LTS08_005258 [Lithohypha guttulata]|nr:hypothetical protein LTS08_005258 [Lithohypha guttulata]